MKHCLKIGEKEREQEMLLQNVYKTNVNEEEKLKDGHKVASAVKNSGLSKRLVVSKKLIT